MIGIEDSIKEPGKKVLNQSFSLSPPPFPKGKMGVANCFSSLETQAKLGQENPVNLGLGTTAYVIRLADTIFGRPW